MMSPPGPRGRRRRRPGPGAARPQREEQGDLFIFFLALLAMFPGETFGNLKATLTASGCSLAPGLRLSVQLRVS